MAVAMFALSGCASYASHMTPKTTPPGEWALSADVDLLVLDRGFGPQVLPNASLLVRRGLSKNLDIGGRISAIGLSLSTRYRFVSSGVFEMAAVLGIGFGFVPVTNRDTGLFNASVRLSLVSGWNLPGDWTLVLSAHAHTEFRLTMIAFAGELRGSTAAEVPGVTAGVRIPIREGWALFPEVGVFFPIGLVEVGLQPLIFHGGIGVQF